MYLFSKDLARSLCGHDWIQSLIVPKLRKAMQQTSVRRILRTSEYHGEIRWRDEFLVEEDGVCPSTVPARMFGLCADMFQSACAESKPSACGEPIQVSPDRDQHHERCHGSFKVDMKS
ncbi:unnamed protein product [Effrenium voratum]|uniref:Uncharacterized protein n=1 Tax=Effrenium voratum TaxID=2562239 RepID=A0AA36MLD7_9DINO|nr:unnamed protein product [Effrenium voratum]